MSHPDPNTRPGSSQSRTLQSALTGVGAWQVKPAHIASSGAFQLGARGAVDTVRAGLAQRPRYHCGDLITWEMRDGSRCVGVIEARVAAGVSTCEVVAATYSAATLANWRFRRDASGHRYVIELDTPRLGFRTIVRSTRFIDARATRLGPV